MLTKRENSEQELCKIQQSLAKPWQKAEQLTFTPGLKQAVILLEDYNI
jgi:hypothetical protein